MKTHKRRKNSRIRGSKTAGWGFRQKHKGHGNKGGVGRAGTGKRGDHKKQVALESDKKKRYFGKQGATSRGTQRKKTNQINLQTLKENFHKKEGNILDFSKYKILGTGSGFKATIKAKSASKSAIDNMQKAGGKIELLVKKEVKKAAASKKKVEGKAAEKVVEKKDVKKTVEKKAEEKAKPSKKK